MHVEVLGRIDLNNPAVYSLSVGEDDFANMAGTIASLFAWPAASRSSLPEDPMAARISFFEANGRFNALLGLQYLDCAGVAGRGIENGFWNPLRCR